jgi:hypothetical protein
MSNLVLLFVFVFTLFAAFLRLPLVHIVGFSVPVQACSSFRSTAASAPDHQHVAVLHRRGRCGQCLLGFEVRQIFNSVGNHFLV